MNASGIGGDAGGRSGAAGQGGSAVVYGVPLSSDRPLDLSLDPSGDPAADPASDPPLDHRGAPQAALFAPVAVRSASRAATGAALQSRPVGSAHADDMMIQTDGEFDANRPGQRWSLHVGREISFHWVHGERAIGYEAHDPAALEEFTYWVVHLVLPMFMALEGIAHIVHGGSVAFGDDAVLFIAPSGGGKSTLVDAFLAQGHELVADDKLPLVPFEAGWFAVPAHPLHRPWRARRDMGRPAPSVAAGPARLAAIYALDVDPAAEETRIAPVTGQQAVARLLGSHLFQLRFMKAEGLAFLGRLAREVPLFDLRTPRQLERLPVLHDEIMAHLADLLAGDPDAP